MPAFNRVILTPVEFVPIRSLRFVLRCVLCLVLTAFNAGVIAFSGVTLYRATAGHPLQLAGLSVLFACFIISLIRVWIVALRTRSL